jgi:hypothetical protein
VGASEQEDDGEPFDWGRATQDAAVQTVLRIEALSCRSQDGLPLGFCLCPAGKCSTPDIEFARSATPFIQMGKMGASAAHDLRLLQSRWLLLVRAAFPTIPQPAHSSDIAMPQPPHHKLPYG